MGSCKIGSSSTENCIILNQDLKSIIQKFTPMCIIDMDWRFTTMLMLSDPFVSSEPKFIQTYKQITTC